MLVFLVCLLVMLTTGCAGAKARYDGAISSIDAHHNTLFSEINVNGALKSGFGQTGWSYQHGESPHGTLIIHTPLPGTVYLLGDRCGVDASHFQPEKGGSLKFDLSQLIDEWVPSMTYCKINVHVQWQLPEGMSSEYPLAGMIGKAHLRFRPDGRLPMSLKWTPGISGDNETTGVAYAQFRESGAIQIAQPVMLEASIPLPLESGVFTLYGCGHGVQNIPFTGSTISVSRETILGKNTSAGQSCTLFGFIRGYDADGLLYEYDGVVGVEVFSRKAQKLSGLVEVRESGEVCYQAEDETSVVVLNFDDTNQASFKLEHCFKPPPGGKARLGFFTVKGRAFYAKIDGSEVTYWQ